MGSSGIQLHPIGFGYHFTRNDFLFLGSLVFEAKSMTIK